jgi:hypothetical protein
MCRIACNCRLASKPKVCRRGGHLAFFIHPGIPQDLTGSNHHGLGKNVPSPQGQVYGTAIVYYTPIPGFVAPIC